MRRRTFAAVRHIWQVSCVDDLLFDQHSFMDIEGRLDCMAKQKYFQANVSKFKNELENKGMSYEEINKVVDGLWRRLILAATKFKAPLSAAAQVAAVRLNMQG